MIRDMDMLKATNITCFTQKSHCSEGAGSAFTKASEVKHAVCPCIRETASFCTTHKEMHTFQGEGEKHARARNCRVKWTHMHMCTYTCTCTCTCKDARAHTHWTPCFSSAHSSISSVQKNADKYFWCQKPFWWCFVVCCRRKAIFLQKLEVWWNLAIFECWLPKNGNNLFSAERRASAFFW